MTTEQRAKAFAWDFYVNDVKSRFGFQSHELYDAYINNELDFDDIILNIHFEDWWEETFIEQLKELRLDALVMLAEELKELAKSIR